MSNLYRDPTTEEINDATEGEGPAIFKWVVPVGRCVHKKTEGHYVTSHVVDDAFAYRSDLPWCPGPPRRTI